MHETFESLIKLTMQTCHFRSSERAYNVREKCTSAGTSVSSLYCPPCMLIY